MKRMRHLFPLVLALLICLCACSSGTEAPASGAVAATEEAYVSEFGGGEGGFDLLTASPQQAPSQDPAGDKGGLLRQSKLIQEADLTLETTDFTAAEAALDSLTGESGGYFERAQIQGGGVYDKNAARYGSYIVRVPADRFEAFLGAAGDVGHVVSVLRSATDVGMEYADAESRLRAQEIKRERLLGLLEQAATMADIIDLENALSETEYQIQQFSGQLTRYDALVDFATIRITLNEVRRLSDEPGQAERLGARVAAAFSDGASGFAAGLGDFAVWCAYHFVGILICAVLVCVGISAVIRVRRKRLIPPPPPPPPAE